MTQEERRIYLIKTLLKEEDEYQNVEIPTDIEEQKRLLRGLFNVRMPKPISEEFIQIQDDYLKEAIKEKGITDISDLTPTKDGFYLWLGDITTIKCGAIVNAANSQLLGCFVPNHLCIDNAIHTYAGIELREACYQIMEKQGHPEETGKAKITPGFNLPCDYVIHTVGPIVGYRVTQKDRDLLASCYRSCLEIADENHVSSIAFCCISTGVFHFPNDEAAEIAINTVKEYKEETQSDIKVIFNVFKDYDLEIYQELLNE